MRLTPMVIVLGLGAAVPGSAQTAPERERLEELRAELSTVADSLSLLRREREGIARARLDRDNALLHLELGFIALRLGEVTGQRQHYDAAAGEFEWAAELQPSWPYAWHGLGLAELALGEHPAIAIENIRQALGKDFLSKAARAFAQAAAVDPAFAQAVIDLAETARRQRIRSRLDVAQRALRAAAATPAGEQSALQLARGRVEREMGEGDSALAAFDAYLAAGGDAGLGQLERARTLFFLRRGDEGRAAYYAGAAPPLGDTARSAYREDISWIATPDELAEFDAFEARAVQAWLADFWAQRDALDGRGAGERLAEHYRRLTYAWRQFRLVSRHRQYTVEPYRSSQSLLDDRGVIYLRHGEPDDRARFVASGVEPNESWVYRRPGGDLLFHFAARGDVQDYKLVESVLDVFGPDTVIAWQARGRVPPLAAGLLESRANLDPSYQRLAANPASLSSGLAAERRRGRAAVREGTATDSYALRFANPLESQFRAYAVGGPRGTSRLLLVFAVPGRRLPPRAHATGTVYPLQLRLAALSPGPVRTFLDTTRVFLSAEPLAGDQFLTGLLEVPIRPGVHDLRAVLMDPDGRVGDVIDLAEIEVPRFSDSSLVISDLVLGDPQAGLNWITSGDTVPMSPLGRYAAGTSLELYYEMHGMPPGTPYRARVEVRGRHGGSIFARIGRLFGGGGPPVSFAFEGVTAGRPFRARQTVNLEPLDPGDYTLSLAVEDPERDIRHQREVRFRVIAR